MPADQVIGKIQLTLHLAVTRLSDRSARQHPGGIPNMADGVTREAFSHEVFSVG